MVSRKSTIDPQGSNGDQKSSARNKVLNRLSNEHKYLFVLLDVLTEQTKALGPGGQADYFTIRDIIDYLTNFPDQYHHPLEDAVYEKLRENHHASTSMVAELLAEHRDMATVTRSLREKLDVLCQGLPGVKRPLLQSHLQEYLQLYRQHINTEESQTFPLAVKHLSESDWLEIESTMRVANDPVFGKRVAKRYRKVIDAIEIASGEIVEDIAITEWRGAQVLLDSSAVLIDGASQVIDVVKHHTERSWQEAFDMVVSSQQPHTAHAKIKLPVMILRNNIRLWRECLIHSNKIRQNVSQSLKESWSWEKHAFGVLINPKENKDSKADD